MNSSSSSSLLLLAIIIIGVYDWVIFYWGKGIAIWLFNTAMENPW
jgi:type IV secretory pathway TrbD component